MINTSLNQTLARTVITSGTVFLSVLALYLFGGEVLEGLRVHDARRHAGHHVLGLVHRAVAGDHAERGAGDPRRGARGAERRRAAAADAPVEAAAEGRAS